MFEMQVRPTPEDIDELDHVSNLVYLRWVQDVAVAHSEDVGLSLADYTRIGAVFVVRRHEIEYRRPTYLGDEITLQTWISEAKAASAMRETRILKGDTEMVRARTRWAFIDKARGRPKRIPEEIHQAFGIEDEPYQ